MRGEYRVVHRPVTTVRELPPRARRIRAGGGEATGGGGTTSACAENTILLQRRCNHSRNYLRVRGEYPACVPAARPRRELPPRARRIRSSVTAGGRSSGTTSACAENTAGRGSVGVGSGNYLRVRGEYVDHDRGSVGGGELPPRARRILCLSAPMDNPIGTTSACAENTIPQYAVSPASRNYLRVRGEYLQERMEDAQILELPPRARRIRGLPSHPTRPGGTTSACAENTPTGRGWVSAFGNYLRVRGEYGGRA